MFQSSPDPEAGRNLTWDVREERIDYVPILARPGGRAQLLPSRQVLMAVGEFQSSPDPEAGRNT